MIPGGKWSGPIPGIGIITGIGIGIGLTFGGDVDTVSEGGSVEGEVGVSIVDIGPSPELQSSVLMGSLSGSHKYTEESAPDLSESTIRQNKCS